MKFRHLAAPAALLTSIGAFATTYALPAPGITINPNYSNNTTIVTIGATTWRGPSAYYYVGECVKPDSPSYRCDILQEDNVPLTAPGQAPIYATITLQSAAVLVRSGHNYWHQVYTVLTGSVEMP